MDSIHYNINPAIIGYAIRAHDETNHTYGKENTSYSLHLSMVMNFVYKYIDLLEEKEVTTAIHAAWLHDTIEDCRKTYNDIKNYAGKQVADIVYALTNLRGHNRNERQGDDYYPGIKASKIATYVKLCDRLANIYYSAWYHDGEDEDSMFFKYKKENKHFQSAIYMECFDPMFKEMNILLQTYSNPQDY